MEMRGETYYRDVLLQMQSEFQRAVVALEKQIASLTQHNELLLAAQHQQQIEMTALMADLESTRQERDQHTISIASLEEALKMKSEDAASAQVEWQTRQEMLEHECTALKLLLQQEQAYWTRYEKAAQKEMDRMVRCASESKAEALHQHDRNEHLKQEIQLLEKRVEAAVQTSMSFEQRLQQIAREKQDQQREMEHRLKYLKRKLDDKREQNKYLTQALVMAKESSKQLQMQQQQQQSLSRPTTPSTITTTTTTGSLSSSFVPSTVSNASSEEQNERRTRKRDLGLTIPLSSTIPASSRSYRLQGKKLVEETHSYASTSATSSSREISPATSPTEKDNKRSIVTKRTSSSARLEREMSGLRRKLDACMQFNFGST